jgi:Domain of unknown function (DUF1963)
VASLIYRAAVTSRTEKILDQIRTEALQRDIPEADVERWLGIARPCALLTGPGDGPVVGRFGGPVMLPADAEDPRYPLLATIDCAALPAGVTDLPLPSDGRLLLFGYPEPEDFESMGDVVYVPAGAAIGEREKYPPLYPVDDPSCAGVYQEFPQGEMHLTADVSLPFVGEVELPDGPPWSAPLPGHPHSEELAEVWADQWGGATLLVGGYGTDFNGGGAVEAVAELAVLAVESGVRSGPTSPDAGDWVLLAELNVSRPGGGAAIFWGIQRDDLIARRFGRAHVVVDWNP